MVEIRKSTMALVVPFLACCLFLSLLVPVAESRKIGVAVYLNNAGSIDIVNGLWLAEAMLYFYDQQNATFIEMMPFLANSGGTPLTMTYFPAIGATQVVARALFKPDPTQYPFDTQNLEIAIEDASGETVQDLEYYFMPELSGISEQLRLRGWSWDPKTSGTASVQTQTYFGTYKVSQFSWTFAVKRVKVVAIQVLLPPIFVLVSVLISFIMPITASITRIGIVGSALISEVSLHNGFKTANGTTASLGLIDYFFFLTYSILLISLAINVLVMVLLRKNSKSTLAVYLERKTKYFVWLVCPGLYTFIFFRGAMIWAAFICLIGPIILYILFAATLPKCRAFQKKMSAKKKKKKDDEIFGDEEMEARLQDDEALDGTSDVKKAVVAHEIRTQKSPILPTDSSDPHLYDTDSD